MKYKRPSSSKAQVLKTARKLFKQNQALRKANKEMFIAMQNALYAETYSITDEVLISAIRKARGAAED